MRVYPITLLVCGALATACRTQIKDMVAELVEAPRQGWAKVRVQQGETSTVSWVNLNAIAMILPLPEKK